MLLDIAEFDRTKAWRGDGSLSMRDWLVAHCHVSRSRARTLVDAAAKANELPALSGALSEGRLTLDVFAPLASVATPDTDADLARVSEYWTPKQARELVSEIKGVTDAEAAARFERRFVRFDDERCLIWAQLAGDSFALVKSAILGRARLTAIRARATPTTSASRAGVPTPCSRSASSRTQAAIDPHRPQHHTVQQLWHPSRPDLRSPRPPRLPKPDPHRFTAAPGPP